MRSTRQLANIAHGLSSPADMEDGRGGYVPSGGQPTCRHRAACVRLPVGLVEQSISYWAFSLLLFFSPSQCGATAERRTQDREVPRSKLACAIWFFL